MRRFRILVLALFLLAAFVAGFFTAPTASATDQVCWYMLCRGEQVRCCEGQVCTCPPQCGGDPPVCW